MMRPMKDSGIEWIGKIPEGWEMDRLKYVATYNDEVLPENLDGNTEIKYIDIGSVSLENGIEHIEEFSFRDAPSRARRVTNSGDIIVSTVRTYLKAIAKIKQNGLIVSTGFCVIRPIKSVCGSYIEYYCKSNAFTDNVSSNSYGISYPAINSSVLMGFYIPSPPLAEQQAIADYLDEKCAAIDKLIDNQKAQIEKMKEYKQSVITEAVTKGLNPSVPMKDSGIEWIGKIPEEWEMDRLKYVATYNDEVLPENLDGNTEIKYIDIGSVSLENGIEHIEEFSFRDAPSRARRVTNSGDIIVSTVRTYLKAIAKIKQNGLIVSTGFCVIRPIKSVCGSYIEYYCKSNAFTDNVSSNSYGISYPAINSSVLMGFYIPSPPLAEQQAIADYLDEKCAAIDKLIAVKQAKIDKLNDYKKSLIYEYVTGKREVL